MPDRSREEASFRNFKDELSLNSSASGSRHLSPISRQKPLGPSTSLRRGPLRRAGPDQPRTERAGSAGRGSQWANRVENFNPDEFKVAGEKKLAGRKVAEVAVEELGGQAG